MRPFWSRANGGIGKEANDMTDGSATDDTTDDNPRQERSIVAVRNLRGQRNQLVKLRGQRNQTFKLNGQFVRVIRLRGEVEGY